MQQVHVIDLGKIAYANSLEIQTQKFETLVNNKLNGQSNNDAHFLYLCEHLPVITLGKSANENNVLIPETLLKEKQIDIFHINRGGDVTFHGLGQITGYPILDLDFFTSDLKKYMRQLEEVIIQTIKVFEIEGYRIEDATGVWVNSIIDKQPKKIAAFGVKSSRWITMHGFALNVDVDLSYFNLINPCGFTDKGVTSIANELKNKDDKPTMLQVKEILLQKFAAVFSAQLIEVAP
ncbi:MAG: lipoyl(octanoyl) transferase LipB [Bacteroidetes bacterium]|nr:lipoyl(octanoyl) transferase LipB [Bacteroidota bacterium]